MSYPKISIAFSCHFPYRKGKWVCRQDLPINNKYCNLGLLVCYRTPPENSDSVEVLISSLAQAESAKVPSSMVQLDLSYALQE